MSHTIWVCGACGKTAYDRYGDDPRSDRGWDESCMLRAVECDLDSIVRGLDGRVTSAKAAAQPPKPASERRDT